MKSKELKLLRKKLEKANKLALQSDLLETLPSSSNNKLMFHLKAATADTPAAIDSPTSVTDQTAAATATKESIFIDKVTYLPSQKLSMQRLQQCLDLFQDNMAKMYQESSWGLDLQEKKKELQHANARFLLLQQDQATTTTTTLSAFVHFRFEYDDEEHPSCAALYVYEIQVHHAYRGQGIGRQLMDILQALGQTQNMSKIVLTVFKTNVGAMKFYVDKLGYIIDETSPSKHNQVEDYEILSLAL